MKNKLSSLEKELKKLQKQREQEKKKKELKAKIWMLKHPKLVTTGERLRVGLKRLREKEVKKRKKAVPQERFADRLNLALSNLSR